MVKKISMVDVAGLPEHESFLVDTNVLCAVHFHSLWDINKVNTYSSFLRDLLKKGITLYVSALSLQELYHLIEKTERKLYEKTHGKINKKDFRKIVLERSRIANELQLIHQQIMGQYVIIDDVLDSEDINEFINKYTVHSYDPIDFTVVSHHASNCPNFITDDSDFKPDGSIVVYSYDDC